MFRSALRLFALALALSGVSGAPTPKAPPANPLASQKGPVLDHLNAELRWYREIQTGSQWISQESDSFFWNNQRKLAAESLRAAFDSSKAEIPLISQPTALAAGGGSAQSQRLAALVATTEDRLQKLTAQKADLDAKLKAAQASGTIPTGLSEQRDVVSAQLSLSQAEDDVLIKMSSYYSSTPEDGANLSVAGIVAALERSVPEIGAPDTGPAAPAAPATTGAAAVGAAPSAAAAPAPEISTSIIGRATQLYALIVSRAKIKDLLTRTGTLEATVTKLREPLRTSLVAITQGSQQVNGQISQTSDPAQLIALRQQVEGWTTQFRELSGVLVPLSQEAALLAQSSDNLTEWQQSLDRQYDRIIKVLLIKTLSTVVLVVLLLMMSEVWRRATFKYVVDVRRRRNYLLIRRIVTGVALVLIVITNFVSDFSSVATFAGFITAGVAVALQSVILSVAAWFFLIGRYGVKPGDRVTISGVTGEVIDIGLVRVYLMEYAGTGVDLHPTGRVVVFANSVLFSSNPLFKQIPGTEFTWHEIYMPVKPEADLAYVKDQIAKVVAKIYLEFRPQLEQQHHAVERLIDFRMEVPEPVATMRFAGSGVELVVRYPLELNRGGEVDSKMAHEVLMTIRSDEKLTAAISGMPQIRSAVRP